MLRKIISSWQWVGRINNGLAVLATLGRKTDVLDYQWLQKLHTCGLLSAFFRPEDQVCVLRSYIRQPDTLIKNASTHVQRMQKVLIQMNLHLHKVISDVTGLTLLLLLPLFLIHIRRNL